MQHNYSSAGGAGFGMKCPRSLPGAWWGRFDERRREDDHGRVDRGRRIRTRLADRAHACRYRSRTCRRQGNGPAVGVDRRPTSASPATPCSGRIGLATGTRLRHDTAVHHATSKQGRFGLTFSDSHASLTDVVQPARPPIDHDSHTAIQHGPNDCE